MEHQSYREILREIALDNYGYVTTQDALEIGVPPGELAKLAHRKKGLLRNVSYGLYRDESVPEDPRGYSHIAEAVLRAGRGSYIHGESVLALHQLALVNPRYIHVASPRPARPSLPTHIKLSKAKAGAKITEYEGIPSQTVTNAIFECRKKIEPQRLEEAAREARRQGLILLNEWAKIEKELDL